MDAAKLYRQITGKQAVYSIMPIDNIPSILKYGIMCFDDVQKIQHQSIALSEVQERRDKIVLANGVRLHQYANLYFSYWNPMLYKRRNQANTICILAISLEVLNLEGCAVSDRNAASPLANFYSPIEGIKILNFNIIHAKSWFSNDLYEHKNNKRIKCAEVLVPRNIPESYIIGAYVVDEEAKMLLLSKGFYKDIYVRPQVFFGKKGV